MVLVPGMSRAVQPRGTSASGGNSPPESCARQEAGEDEAGDDMKPDKETQKRKVLQALKSGNWLSTYELEDASGSRRIGARIWDLKREGAEIEGRFRKFPVYEYRLSA